MPDLTTVTLPAGLTSIPKDAFANSAKLATVKFGTADANNGGSGQRATTTGTLDFSKATALTSIGQNAFAGTAASTVDLSTITAANFTTIDNSVFKDMASLTEVKLPATITTINQSAFQNDAKLVKLTQAEAAANGGVQAREEDPATTATFGSKLTSIGQNAFQGTGFTTVDLSKAVGTQASGTPSATTPLSVGSGAFTNMADLTEVKLPANSNINPAYFGNPTTATDKKLKTITYGANAKTDPAAFSGTSNTFSGTNYNKISNETIDLTGYANLTTLGTGVLFGNTAMTTLKMNAPIMSLSGANVSVADPV